MVIFVELSLEMTITIAVMILIQKDHAMQFTIQLLLEVFINTLQILMLVCDISTKNKGGPLNSGLRDLCPFYKTLDSSDCRIDPPPSVSIDYGNTGQQYSNIRFFTFVLNHKVNVLEQICGQSQVSKFVITKLQDVINMLVQMELLCLLKLVQIG
jgi:hypothetical protein